MSRFLSANDLNNPGSSLADMSRALLQQQYANWPMLQKGADTLKTVVSKEITFDGFRMSIQFNPGRIVSSAAKVDKKSIAERKCFLCLENLPPEQKGVETGDYTVLCNPFPIFPEHFTIPHKRHIDQRISGAFPDMLQLTKEMGSRYSLFYNGPKCGASAPDHLHFQAGDFGFMGIDNTWPDLVKNHGIWLSENVLTRIASVDDGLRRFIVINSSSHTESVQAFNTLFNSFSAFNEDPEEEPMVNVLTSYRQNRWTTIVFLRKKHRPNQFFLDGDAQILFSPASVDFGGVCITPLERDFDRLNADLLTDMFTQLSADKAVLMAVSDSLQS
ncbi:MAG: DUF4922 domain-containing protein [Bacteroidetes bacterium]|nr:DUF4922 domain-containing protein [Bacteroidota bacterium]